jgi:hypothetical protein
MKIFPAAGLCLAGICFVAALGCHKEDIATTGGETNNLEVLTNAMANGDLYNYDKKEAMRRRMDMIILPELKYDGTPFPQVMKDMIELSARLDPFRSGINFLVEASDPSTDPASVDPSQALSTLSNVVVRINPPLKQIALSDALDAISKVAEPPIKYSVEDYGVVFGPKPIRISTSQLVKARESSIATRTFHVDTNIFSKSMQSVFGVKLSGDGDDTTKAQQTQKALRQWLSQLGVNMEPTTKSVAYNEYTGVLMVRATIEDLDICQPAIETLGGSVVSTYPAGGGYTESALRRARNVRNSP